MSQTRIFNEKTGGFDIVEDRAAFMEELLAKNAAEEAKAQAEAATQAVEVGAATEAPAPAPQKSERAAK